MDPPVKKRSLVEVQEDVEAILENGNRKFSELSDGHHTSEGIIFCEKCGKKGASS